MPISILMDVLDIGSVYDQLGTPIGLTVYNGKKTERFISRFYNMFEPWENSYPPSRYPLNFHKDRAPRIILGADSAERPVILWLEGAGKFGYRKGTDSAVASLSEAAEIACPAQPD